MTTQTEIELLDQLDAIDTPPVHEFDLSIIMKGAVTKTAKLINNSNPNEAIKSEHRWFTYKLAEPIFAKEISVEAEGFLGNAEFEFRYAAFPTDNSYSESVRAHGGQFKLVVGRFITNFSFRPPRQYFSERTIHKVNLIGLSANEFATHSKILSNLIEKKDQLVAESQLRLNEIDEKQDSLDDYEEKSLQLQSSIKDFRATESTVQSSISKLENTRDQISERIGLLKNTEGELQARVDSFEDLIDQKQVEQKKLNADTETLRAKLQKLKSDINMFPSEISGYNTEAGKQVRMYAFLAAIPIALFVCVTFVLFSRAADLTYVITSSEDVDVFSIFITRLPFVTVATAILAVSYKISKQLILEIVEINRKRQKLTQVSIVASDVTTAAAHELSLTDERRFESRIALRMSLLKDVLTGLISEGYSYPAKNSHHFEEEEPEQTETQEYASDLEEGEGEEEE